MNDTPENIEQVLREARDFMLKMQPQLPPEYVAKPEWRELSVHLEKRVEDGPNYRLTPEEVQSITDPTLDAARATLARIAALGADTE